VNGEESDWNTYVNEELKLGIYKEEKNQRKQLILSLYFTNENTQMQYDVHNKRNKKTTLLT
jgi:hypothetical protein